MRISKKLPFERNFFSYKRCIGMVWWGDDGRLGYTIDNGNGKSIMSEAIYGSVPEAQQAAENKIDELIKNK